MFAALRRDNEPPRAIPKSGQRFSAQITRLPQTSIAAIRHWRGRVSRPLGNALATELRTILGADLRFNAHGLAGGFPRPTLSYVLDVAVEFREIRDRGIPEHGRVDAEIDVGQQISHFLKRHVLHSRRAATYQFDNPISSFSDILNAFGDSISASSVGHKLLLRHTADVLSHCARLPRRLGSHLRVASWLYTPQALRNATAHRTVPPSALPRGGRV